MSDSDKSEILAKRQTELDKIIASNILIRDSLEAERKILHEIMINKEKKKHCFEIERIRHNVVLQLENKADNLRMSAMVEKRQYAFKEMKYI